MKNQKIIISKTPLRISFVGGGSDLKSYFRHTGYGQVISTSIDKYIYITVHKRYDDLIRASYSKTETVENLKDMNHELIRESLDYMGINKGVEITSISDLTAHGTGLGSSSAYTIGVLNALSNFKNKKYSKFNLANDASFIEIDVCGNPIGYQDQFACSFGGMNEIKFTEKSIDVTPINIKTKDLNKLSKNLLLFDTGIKRKSSSVLSKQKENYKNKKLKNTEELVKLLPEFKNCLTNGCVSDVGKLLHESWLIKKSIVDDISNQYIDEMYEAALMSGATGGKLCGAGGGGFLLLYVKDSEKETVRRGLLGLRELQFDFDYEGATIL